MTIPLGIKGSVRNSEHVDHTILVQSDMDTTGGFLILEWWKGSTGPNEHGAFDNWVADEASLEAYIAEAGWHVAWNDKAENA